MSLGPESLASKSRADSQDLTTWGGARRQRPRPSPRCIRVPEGRPGRVLRNSEVPDFEVVEIDCGQRVVILRKSIDWGVRQKTFELSSECLVECLPEISESSLTCQNLFHTRWLGSVLFCLRWQRCLHPAVMSRLWKKHYTEGTGS